MNRKRHTRQRQAEGPRCQGSTAAKRSGQAQVEPESPAHRPHLRCTPSVARATGARSDVRPAPHLAADVEAGTAYQATATRYAKRPRASAVRMRTTCWTVKKWVANFTHIWTTEGWLYVAAELDLYSRRIEDWSMQESMSAQLHLHIIKSSLDCTRSPALTNTRSTTPLRSATMCISIFIASSESKVVPA